MRLRATAIAAVVGSALLISPLAQGTALATTYTVTRTSPCGYMTGTYTYNAISGTDLFRVTYNGTVQNTCDYTVPLSAQMTWAGGGRDVAFDYYNAGEKLPVSFAESYVKDVRFALYG
ncbi:hypothetical protein [Actinomadura oligospora]|uniref:hypothetical protein n=1 Tax=Actinomadura oligospora TaxID=111804 RepID=UPI00047CBFA2|nr:hypothetical protein [Actinomadura oligospora]